MTDGQAIEKCLQMLGGEGPPAHEYTPSLERNIGISVREFRESYPYTTWGPEFIPLDHFINKDHPYHDVIETLWSCNDMFEDTRKEGSVCVHPPMLLDWMLLVLCVKRKITGWEMHELWQ
jgi:hypothetical protein